MAYVIGIDASLSCTGVAIFAQVGAGVVVRTATYSSDPSSKNIVARMQRVTNAVQAVCAALPTEDVVAVGIEDYAFHAKGRNLAYYMEFLGMLRGALVARYPNLGVNFVEVGISQVKKWATGAGDCDGKAPVISAMTLKYQRLFNTDDEADATVVAEIAGSFANCAGFEPQTDAQREVLNALRNGPVVKKRKRKVATPEAADGSTPVPRIRRKKAK